MEILRKLLASKYTEYTINGVIALYAILLAIESSVGEQWAVWIKSIEYKIVLVLCGEIVLRAVVRTRVEFRSGWFWFDAGTTVLAFVPGYEAFRAYRLLRIVGRLPYFKRAVEQLFLAFRRSVPHLGLAGFLVAVNALVGHQAFGTSMEDKFGTVGHSFLTTLFSVFLEDLFDTYFTMFEQMWPAALAHLVMSIIVGIIILSQIISMVIDACREQQR